MDKLKKRFAMLLIPVTLILIGALLVARLAAQGPPPCANACWQTYLGAVKACNGNPTCLAAARKAAETCVFQSCGLPPR